MNSTTKQQDDYNTRLERCSFLYNKLLYLAERKITGTVTIHFKNGHILKYDETFRKQVKIEPES